MGSFPFRKKAFCCCDNNQKKLAKFDIDLKEKEFMYDSDTHDIKKQSVMRLKEGKLKLRTKTLKNLLNNNKLDDSDHVIHLREKKSGLKKKKKKNKHSNSNHILWRRAQTNRLRRQFSIKILKRRRNRNIKRYMKTISKNNSFHSNKIGSYDNKEIKEIKLKIIKDVNKVEESINNNKNKDVINNNIINNNIINNINININENKITNNKINIKVNLNNNNEIEYKKGKTNKNKEIKNNLYLKNETDEGGNSVYIKIISEKSIDLSHGNIERPNKSIILNKINKKDMESNLKITIDNSNHSKTVNYNKLNKVHSSSNNSYDNYTAKYTKKSFCNKTVKSLKNSKNKFKMTRTGPNSSDSFESDDSSETTIKFYEKLEKEEEDFIKNVLKNNKILSNELDDDAIEQILHGFYCVEFQKGQTLYMEGNEAKIFYIIFTGKVLIYNEDFEDKNKNENNFYKTNNYTFDNKNSNKNSNPFSIIHPKTIDEGNQQLKQYTFNTNKSFKNGDIISGKFSINSFKLSKELIKGECFGQESFKEDGLRIQNAKVLERSKIFCCSGEFYRNAKNYMILKIAKERKNLLNKLPLFKYCEEKKLLALSKKLKEVCYNYCSIIINENEMNNNIYVVKEGDIRITKKFKKICSLQKESYFGHINLILKKPNIYTYSIESKKAILYEIPHSFFLDINLNDLIYKIFLHAIKTSIRIKQLFIHNNKYFYKIFKMKYYQDGEIVYKKNFEQNKKLCVIISGCLKEEKTNIIKAKEEEVFGDNIIDSKENLNSEILSSGESLIFEASWNNIISSCELDKKNNLDIFETVKNLKRVKIFNNIHEIKMLELAKIVTKETYKDNSIISKEGGLSNKFYIVKKGKVKLFQKLNFIREIDTGGFFGEIPGITGVVKLFTAISVGETECYVITKKNFSLLEEPSFLDSIKDYGFLDDLNVELSDLFIVKGLGRGKFGKVYLVHNTKHFYAIKVALLSEILNMEKLKYYLKEKEIMKMLDFPFVLRFVKSLKTDYHIFFLEEYIEGITLRKYLSNRKKENSKNLNETGFYGAILLLVLNYIHNKKIIHRDIKPDNCMIDQKGYLKIIDFGISKYLKDQDLTNTICGTPHYMAPEIISGKNYSFSADYWSYGVTLFEIFYDYLPFGQGASEVLDIYQQILSKKLILPYDPKFNQFNAFLKIILAKNILHRVCNFKLLKSHPFFQDYQFEQILNHSIKPPFIPEIENDIKNLTICNKSVLDYFKKEIKRDSDVQIKTKEEFILAKQLLDEF